MKFDALVDFLEHRMSLSHIYQPLLIRSLVEAGATATLRQLAHAFLAQDESQLLFYEKRIKEMPLRVLTGHGVVRRDGDLILLATEKLTLEQRARVKMLCEMRMQEYVQKRGLAIWDHRLLEADPVPDNLRYRVLAVSGGRCALCGCTKNERPLDVDHIIPRSRGGKNVLANLQVLCAKCNRTKGNKDALTTTSRSTGSRSRRSTRAVPLTITLNGDLLPPLRVDARTVALWGAVSPFVRCAPRWGAARPASDRRAKSEPKNARFHGYLRAML